MVQVDERSSAAQRSEHLGLRPHLLHGKKGEYAAACPNTAHDGIDALLIIIIIKIK